MAVKYQFKKGRAMEKKVSYQRTAVKAGVLTFAAMAGYFGLMKLFGLVYILELRLFNFAILGGGILLAMNHYKKMVGHRPAYLDGIGMGCLTTLVAVGLFAIFIYYYLRFDAGFMDYVRKHALMGGYLEPITAAIGVSLEGISSGFVFAFMSMMYFKRYETTHNAL
jgi:hypothetical protein